MNFLSPYMFWGMAAAGIPIALHFFFRSRYRTVPWAAMKFLLTSIEQTSRRLKFQELLLLIARVLLLLLLALALARPSETFDEVGERGPVDAVLVFDTSFSMGAAEGKTTRFEQAKKAAKDILAKLPPHSTVRIVAGADRFTVHGPSEPADLGQAATIIDGLELSDLASDLYPGISEAESLLERCKAKAKELYLFSDMQKLGWDRQGRGLDQKLRDVKDLARIHLVRCGAAMPKNAAVVGITPQTATPRPGERVGFSVLVKNTGTEALQNLEIFLLVDNNEKTKEIQALDFLGAGGMRAVTVMAKMDQAGLRIISAGIKHDDLPGDNRFDQVIRVRDKVNVLIVEGPADDPEPHKAPSFNLAHALVGLRQQTRVVQAKLAAPALLNDQDVCILTNVPLRPDVEGMQKAVAAVEKWIADQAQLRDRTRNADADRLTTLAKEQDELAGKLRKELSPCPSKGLYAIAQTMEQAGSELSGGKAAEVLQRQEQILRSLAETRKEFNRQLTDLRQRRQDLATQSRLGDCLPADFVQALDGFVRQGKNLAIFPGDHVAGKIPLPGKKADYAPFQDYNDQLGNKYGLLPARIIGLFDFPPPPLLGKKTSDPKADPTEWLRECLYFDRYTLELPAFSKIKGDVRYKNFNETEVYRALDLAEPAPDDASPNTDRTQVVMRFTRIKKEKDKDKPLQGDQKPGEPAVLLRQVGAGQVWLFATSADPGWKKDALDFTWNNWPLQPTAYQPFLDMTLAHMLHGQTQNFNLVAGKPLTWLADDKEPQAYLLIHPDGTHERLGVGTVQGGRKVVTAESLTRAGIYRLHTTAPPDPRAPDAKPPVPHQPGWPLAVIPDLAESKNLESLSAAQIDGRLGFQPVHLVAGEQVALEKEKSAPSNREWTAWVLLVVLLLAIGEMFLAWWCARSW